MKDGCILELKNIPILIANKPTRRGLLYSSETLQSVISDPIWKEKENQRVNFVVTGFNEPWPCVDVARICATAYNSRIEDDKLMVDIDVLDVPSGRVLKSLIDNNYPVFFQLVGNGDYDTKGNVTDYEPLAIVMSTFSAYEEE